MLLFGNMSHVCSMQTYNEYVANVVQRRQTWQGHLQLYSAALIRESELIKNETY